MFGSKKPSDDAPEVTSDAKGRPTPKRREVEAAQKRPLAPTGRASNAQMTRDQRLAARDRMNRALQTGDERYLPARDKGPARRWTRDWIDSRTSIGEFFLIVAIIMIISVFGFQKASPTAGVVIMLLMYLVTFAFAIDATVRGVMLRRALNKKFPASEIPRGTVWYGVSRSIQMRRTRLPKPQVKRGQQPS